MSMRLLPVDTADGAGNMAADASLLETVQAGGPSTLRLYRWTEPTLSFGRNQPARGRYDTERAADRGIAFVRRPTGGQAVLHDDELTYSVAAPVELLGKPRTAYRRINQALVAGLRELGLDAAVAGDGAGPSGGAGHDWAAACFRSPAPGEVVVRGLKVVGSAQRYERGAILQHGSILVGGTQLPAEELTAAGVSAAGVSGTGASAAAPAGPSPRPPAAGTGWTTLKEMLGRRPSWTEIEGAIVAGWESVIGTGLAPGHLSVAEASRVEALRERYASPDWTWRR